MSECVLKTLTCRGLRVGPSNQVSFEPGFGAYKTLMQKINVAFSRVFPSFCSSEPGGPKDRKNSFSLDRLKKPFPHARINHSRLKFSFLVRKFDSRSKISIPGPVFLQPGRGQIEKTILDRKFHSEIEFLNFSVSHLEIEFFQSLGPLRGLEGDFIPHGASRGMRPSS